MNSAFIYVYQNTAPEFENV